MPDVEDCHPVDPSEYPFEEPAGSCTPPTLLVVHSPSHSRQCAMAQLRPVSVPDVVKNLAGKDPNQALKDFDGHYMPEGHPDADDSARGYDDAHCSQLKLNADGISQSLCYVLHF